MGLLVGAAWRGCLQRLCPEGAHRRGLLGKSQPSLREFYRRAYPEGQPAPREFTGGLTGNGLPTRGLSGKG